MKKVSVKEIVLQIDGGVEIGAKFKPDGVEILHPNALELQSVADALIIFGEFLNGRPDSAKGDSSASPDSSYSPSQSPYDSGE
ncbi:MAG: hypothetical protein FWD25_07100 [Clostridia bacterium]|nr:hypothetical protein [Clostridia bacterium]